ncbi:MAG: hypothetical protein WC516_03275 [Patescibacteria group bacterium]
MLSQLKNFDYSFWSSYIFSIRAYIPHSILKIMAVVFVLLLVVGLVLRLIAWRKKTDRLLANLWRRYADCLIAMGILGLIMAVCYYELVPILSARLLWVFWLIAIIWWLLRIVNYQYKKMPQTRQQLEQKKLLTKYLPNKK